MKKLILSLLLLGCASAYADNRNIHEYKDYRYHYHHYNQMRNSDWIAPLIIGGVIGYEINRHNDAPTVILPPPQPVQILPPPPIGYKYVQMIDAQCNCYRTVLVPN